MHDRGDEVSKAAGEGTADTGVGDRRGQKSEE